MIWCYIQRGNYGDGFFFTVPVWSVQTHIMSISVCPPYIHEGVGGESWARMPWQVTRLTTLPLYSSPTFPSPLHSHPALQTATHISHQAMVIWQLSCDEIEFLHRFYGYCGVAATISVLGTSKKGFFMLFIFFGLINHSNMVRFWIKLKMLRKLSPSLMFSVVTSIK